MHGLQIEKVRKREYTFRMEQQEKGNRAEQFPFDGKYTFLDVENPNIYTDTVCAISLIVVEDHKEVLRHTELINPKTFFSGQNISVHKIRPKDVKGARTFREFFAEFRKYFSPDYVLAGHNINSDISIINRDLSRSHKFLKSAYCLDTSDLMKDIYYQGHPEKGMLRLKNAAASLNIPIQSHDPESDVNACYEIVRKLADGNEFDLKDYIHRIPPSKIYSPGEMKRNMQLRKARRELARKKQSTQKEENSAGQSASSE